MIKSRKGITPVIAIVLLLLITVGAVGVVYTQFQGLVEGDDAQEQLESQQQIQQASYSIAAVEVINDDTAAGEGEIDITIQNTGDTALNFDNTAYTVNWAPEGTNPVSVDVAGDGCELDPVAPEPGDTASCNVGELSDGLNDNAVSDTVEFQIQDSIKASYSCDYDGSALPTFC